jgi:hypothetical protein
MSVTFHVDGSLILVHVKKEQIVLYYLYINSYVAIPKAQKEKG